MKNFRLDENGIYVNNIKNHVFYQDRFNDICFEVEDHNFWFNNRNEILKEVINNFTPKSTFADVGGGNGYQIHCLSMEFPQSKFFLIEPGYNGCRNARKRSVENVYNCSVDDFDFIETNINAVGLFDVIEHIEDDTAFLKKLVEITPPDTVFYIATPTYKLFWNDMDEITGHFRRFNKKTIKQLGQRAGLRPLYFTYYFSYLTLPYFFFRVIPYWLGRRSSEDEIIQGEVNAQKKGILLSKIFTPFHIIESLLVRYKLTIPFGNSCIAVFKK